MGPTGCLLDRAGELRRIGAIVDAAARGSGRLLLIDGEAGIGKTQLLAAAKQIAGDRGLIVLAARGGELERDFAYGIVRQLFEPPVRGATASQRRQLLTGAAELAAPVLGLAAADEPRAPGGDRTFAAQHGLYWLAANMAARRPVVICVDDAQWADAASLRWLLYLARRLEGLPLAVVLTTRIGEPQAPEALLQALRIEPLAETMSPRRLGEHAVGVLVRDVLGAPSDPAFTAACHDVTGGNPFLLMELLGVLARDAISPRGDAAGRVHGLCPESVERSVLARLGRLSPACIALARSIAVLEADADLRRATMLADVEPADGQAAAIALAETNLITAEHPHRFIHPLVRAAVYGDLPAVRRAAAHGQAARLLDADGADPERVALHLLAAAPEGDPWAVAQLRAAGRRALARGAADSAVILLRRALEEPAPRSDRPSVLRELGSAELLAPSAEAVTHLRAALKLTPDARERAQIALEMGRAEMLGGGFRAAVETFDAALADLGSDDRELRLRLQASALGAAQMDLELRPLVLERLARVPDDLPGQTPGERLLLTYMAIEGASSGRSAARTAQLAERALADGRLLAEETSDSQIFALAVCALAAAGELERAYGLFSDALADARARGSSVGFAISSCMRSFVAYRLGRLADAEADARAALPLAESPGLLAIRGYSIAFLVDALIERGDLDGAWSTLQRAPEGWERLQLNHVTYIFAARGVLHVARGELRQGVDDLRECGRRQAASGIVNPDWFAWQSRAALALLQLGQRAEALELARDELELARTFGARRAIGMALRAVGLVEGGARGLSLLADAVEVLADSPARVERARALVELGAALRRANQRAAARDCLRDGLELAHRCGAGPLAGRAREELRAAGSRPRRFTRRGVDALTPSEHRVAQMAAGGMSNPQIAQALFVTRKTVETHLQSAYRKLEIKRRDELARAFEAPAVAVR